MSLNGAEILSDPLLMLWRSLRPVGSGGDYWDSQAGGWLMSSQELQGVYWSVVAPAGWGGIAEEMLLVFPGWIGQSLLDDLAAFGSRTWADFRGAISFHALSGFTSATDGAANCQVGRTLFDPRALRSMPMADAIVAGVAKPGGKKPSAKTSAWSKYLIKTVNDNLPEEVKSDFAKRDGRQLRSHGLALESAEDFAEALAKYAFDVQVHPELLEVLSVGPQVLHPEVAALLASAPITPASFGGAHTIWWTSGKRDWEDQPGVVMLPADQVKPYLHDYAVLGCQTWAEVCQVADLRMFQDCLENLWFEAVENGDIEEDDFTYNPLPNKADEFDLYESGIPGWEESGFPLAPESMMESALPADFRKQFDHGYMTTLDGWFCKFTPDNVPAYAAWFADHGFAIEEHPELAVLFTDPAPQTEPEWIRTINALIGLDSPPEPEPGEG